MSSFLTPSKGLEYITCRRSRGAASEDAIALSPHCLAVIDGADDLVGEPWAGLAPGHLAAITAQDTIEALETEPDPLELVLLISEAILAVRDDLRDVMGPSASLLAYLPRRRVIVRVGAGAYRIGDGPVSHGLIPLEAAAAEMRAEATRQLLAEGHTEEWLALCDPGRQAIMSTLRTSRYWANAGVCGLGYGAINGDPVPHRFIEVVPVPAGSRVCLSSGYPTPGRTLDESELELCRSITEDPLRIGVGNEGVRGMLEGENWVSDRSFLSFDT